MATNPLCSRPLCAQAPLCSRPGMQPMCSGYHMATPRRSMCSNAFPMMMWNPGMRQKMMQMMQMYQQYQPKPIDKPVENPNIIKIHKPKLAKPTRSPQEALRIILDSIRPGFQENGNLFEQGLTSFNVMQMVTRAGEQGYVLTMRDVIAEPTFEAIASKMKTEE